MKAWLLERTTDLARDHFPLRLGELPVPVPGDDEVLIRVSCCGICHTELDEIEGRTPPRKFPVVPGHQVVGKVEQCGKRATKFAPGERAGVAWIFSACGSCTFCRSGRENLCPEFRGTGRDANGGYAEYIAAPEKFVYRIPADLPDTEAAPLLCAGAIGYRALRLCGISDGEILGLAGFGASAHLVLKLVRHLFPATNVFVFTRSVEEQQFALSQGAKWAGGIHELPPDLPHAIIDTTPAWEPVLESLLRLRPGGRLVINAIRKEEKDKQHLQQISYERHLWMEKEIKSVANITRADVEAFLDLAAKIPLRPEVQLYPFEKANKALLDLRFRQVKGAKVLVL